MTELTVSVEVVEVAARDGLQNDPTNLPTATKAELIIRAAAAGIRRIEASSFVSPKTVPKLSDAEVLMEMLRSRHDLTGISLIGLVVNERGVQRAVAAGVQEINAVVLTTDTFSWRNQGAATAETLKRLPDIAGAARAAGVRVSVTVGAAFGCPYEGEVPLDRLVEVTGAVARCGPDEIALADTIGVAVPADVSKRVRAVQQATGGMVPLRAHFHNTRNMGYANAAAAIAEGVLALDASLGGIGGCPFAPAATGNIATEDLGYLLQRSGIDHRMNLGLLVDAVEWLCSKLGHPVPGMISKAGLFPPQP
jgi:hydroxymethylglutaryl-CoA lyase